ncbi:synaptonemal complex central element protein 2 isoform X2 [Mixophyes fleayi]|uniref:synaptonemal complex central element protein 2 isoform X2 n=1 Tax=Mixophyes fleayi TaxID=3061075 RepID=UPI003F4DD618
MADSETDRREVREGPITATNAKADWLGPSSDKTSSRPSSPLLPNSASDAASTSSLSDGKSSSYFATLEASVDGLQRRAQSLIDKINEGRSSDQDMMKSFNTSLSMKVTELSQCLEERMYQMYEQNNTLLQARLQEFSQVVERIRQLQSELKHVCQTVATVYKDL